jgi:TolB protein
MGLVALMALVPIAARGETLTQPGMQECSTTVLTPPTTGASGDEPAVHELWRILSRDLSIAGPFKVLPEPGPLLEPHGQALVLTTRVVHRHPGSFMVRVLVNECQTRKLIYQKSYEGSPVWVRGMAHRIADDFTEKITGRRGSAESRIVFSQATSPGAREIYQVDGDGEGLLQLTQHHSLSLSPTLAPDGRLAYVTYKGGPPEIWGQREPGGPQVRLFPESGSQTGVLLSPAWAPVGNKLAFVKSDPQGRCDVMVLDLDRNQVAQITAKEGSNTEPAWDPTGTRIAFTSNRDGTPQIYLMNSDGSSPRQITSGGSANSNPSWEPDGLRLAYESRSDGHFNVCLFDFNDGKTSRITQGTGPSESPVWSPDGRWIAFIQSVSGTSRLMVSDLLGHLVRPLGFLAHVQSPDWSRNR